MPTSKRAVRPGIKNSGKQSAIISEWTLIHALKGLISRKGVRPPDALIKGIGDDCAIFAIDANRYGLITTDISIENVHFRRDISTPREIGFKAMSGNLSDIAAMGGTPLFAFVSMGVPAGFGTRDIKDLYAGMIDAANAAGVSIAGGDTSTSAELVVNVALYGDVERKRLITRSGAGPGDRIYVTGTLGDSMAGLELLLKNPGETRFRRLVQKHKKPVSRHAIVQSIVEQFGPTAMIDISDGLVSDLRHISSESNCGFRIDRERLPVSPVLRRYAASRGVEPVEYALASGEEYELLFTARPGNAAPAIIGTVAVTPIGEIIANGCFISEQRIDKNCRYGYDHFKPKAMGGDTECDQ